MTEIGLCMLTFTKLVGEYTGVYTKDVWIEWLLLVFRVGKKLPKSITIVQ